MFKEFAMTIVMQQHFLLYVQNNLYDALVGVHLIRLNQNLINQSNFMGMYLFERWWIEDSSWDVTEG